MNYDRIVSEILNNREMNARLIDDLMIPLAARQEKYEKKFLGKLKKYSSILKRLDAAFPAYLMSQFVAFELFCENGLGEKYLNHRKMKQITADERAYIEKCLQYPWRFSFYRLKEELEDSLYTMVDICTGEEFTLYSGGTNEILDSFGEDILYFTLLGYNGEIYETYGVISYFCSFSDKDILAFAKSIKSSVEEMDDIPALIAKDPTPFMMLFAFAELPDITRYKDLEVLLCSCEIENFFPPTREVLEKEFTVVEKRDILRCTVEQWAVIPHFSALYIDMKKKRLLLYSGTKEGYYALRDHAGNIEIPIPDEPDMEMSSAMVHASEEILNKNRVQEHYAALFREELTHEDEELLNSFNACLSELKEYINNNQKIPYEELAIKYDVEVEHVKSIEKSLLGVLGE